MRARGIVVLVAVALSAGCFRSGYTKGEYPVERRAPSCELSELLVKDDARAESEASRKEILAAWETRRALDAEWEHALRALGADLGLKPEESDVPVVLDALEERAKALVAKGCTAKVAHTGKLGYALGCRKAEGDVKRLRDEMSAIVDRHLEKLLDIAERFSAVKVTNRKALSGSTDCGEPGNGRADVRSFQTHVRDALRGGSWDSGCSYTHQETCLSACLLADASACEIVSNQYAASGDMEASYRYTERACTISVEAGAPSTACAGVVARILSAGGKQYDAKRGLELVDRLCADPESLACGLVEHNLLIPGTPHFSRERAQRPLAKMEAACRAKPDYRCATAVRAHAEGLGDLARAAELAELACRAGPDLCAQVAGALQKADPPRAGNYAKRACDADPKHCASVAAIFVKSDYKRAAAYAKRACDADAKLCAQAAYVFLGHDDATARSYAERGCEADANACFVLAGFHEQGKAGLPKSEEKARAVYQKVCDKTKNTAWCRRAKKP